MSSSPIGRGEDCRFGGIPPPPGEHPRSRRAAYALCPRPPRASRVRAAGRAPLRVVHGRAPIRHQRCAAATRVTSTTTGRSHTSFPGLSDIPADPAHTGFGDSTAFDSASWRQVVIGNASLSWVSGPSGQRRRGAHAYHPDAPSLCALHAHIHYWPPCHSHPPGGIHNR